MLRLTRRLLAAVALLGCLAAPATAAAREFTVSWSESRASFSGTLYVNAFTLKDGEFFVDGHLTGTTQGRHGTGTVDHAVGPRVLAMSASGPSLHLEVGPLDAKGSSGDWSSTGAIALDASAGYRGYQVEDALARNLSKLHLLSVLNAFANGSPGPITGIGGKCLDVAGANTANGTPVQLWECNGTNAQKWSYRRVNPRGTPINEWRALGKCLDVAGNGTANGTRVHLWECNGTTAQQWAQPTSDPMLHAANGSSKCLDAVDRQSADGTRVQIWDCHGDANQRWIGIY